MHTFPWNILPMFGNEDINFRCYEEEREMAASRIEDCGGLIGCPVVYVVWWQRTSSLS